jgi:hypothetical protein
MMQRLENDEAVYENEIDAVPMATVSNEAILVVEESIDIPEPVFEEDDEARTDEPIEEEETVLEPEPVVKKAIQKAAATPVVEQIVLPSAIDTGLGFEIRLPPGKLEAIVKSISTTPHEGYKPVVGLHENGKIVIDWVEVQSF